MIAVLGQCWSSSGEAARAEAQSLHRMTPPERYIRHALVRCMGCHASCSSTAIARAVWLNAPRRVECKRRSGSRSRLRNARRAPTRPGVGVLHDADRLPSVARERRCPAIPPPPSKAALGLYLSSSRGCSSRGPGARRDQTCDHAGAASYPERPPRHAPAPASLSPRRALGSRPGSLDPPLRLGTRARRARDVVSSAPAALARGASRSRTRAEEVEPSAISAKRAPGRIGSAGRALRPCDPNTALGRTAAPARRARPP